MPLVTESQVQVQQQNDPRPDLKSPPRTKVPSRSKEKKTKPGDLPVIPVGLINLFDGISTVLPTFVQKFQAHPPIFIAAENDHELRQIVSAHTGLRMAGSWTKLDTGTIGIYVADVLRLIDNDSSILREAAKFRR